MVLAILYWSFVATVGVYILKNGAALECRIYLLITVASILSVLAAIAEELNFQRMDSGILAIDAVLLALLLLVALRTNRFWPLWTTGFHSVGVATHIAMATKPDVVPGAYALAQGFWAYPMLIAICLGVRTQRRKTATLR